MLIRNRRSSTNSAWLCGAWLLASLIAYQKGLQRQIDILRAFCSARGLKVNVQQTKTMVFEHWKSQTSPFTYAGNDIEEVGEFKYLGMFLEYSRTRTPAIEYLCKAATRAMFALQRRCQQLHLHDPGIKCKLCDTLVKPILCYGCEIWAIVGNRTDLDKLERIQQGFLKRKEGRGFPHPWQPTRLNGWNSVCLSSA